MLFNTNGLPKFPGWGSALGPGIVLMALAQGSGKPIWRSCGLAKYGLTFLTLADSRLPDQNIEIGRYTLVSGKSIFQWIIRRKRSFGVILWVLFYSHINYLVRNLLTARNPIVFP